MDNSLKTKEKPPEEGGYPPHTRGKTKTFLIGKELKTNDLHHTAADRASGPATNPHPNPRIAVAEGRVKPLARLLTLRYGPAGDSAPRLRLKASSMTERFPFGPSTRPAPPLSLLNSASPRSARSSPGRGTRRSGPWTARTDLESSATRERGFKSKGEGPLEQAPGGACPNARVETLC